jgi:hypothetical protein
MHSHPLETAHQQRRVLGVLFNEAVVCCGYIAPVIDESNEYGAMVE